MASVLDRLTRATEEYERLSAGMDELVRRYDRARDGSQAKRDAMDGMNRLRPQLRQAEARMHQYADEYIETTERPEPRSNVTVAPVLECVVRVASDLSAFELRDRIAALLSDEPRFLAVNVTQAVEPGTWRTTYGV